MRLRGCKENRGFKATFRGEPPILYIGKKCVWAILISMAEEIKKTGMSLETAKAAVNRADGAVLLIEDPTLGLTDVVTMTTVGGGVSSDYVAANGSQREYFVQKGLVRFRDVAVESGKVVAEGVMIAEVVQIETSAKLVVEAEKKSDTDATSKIAEAALKGAILVHAEEEKAIVEETIGAAGANKSAGTSVSAVRGGAIDPVVVDGVKTRATPQRATTTIGIEPYRPTISADNDPHTFTTDDVTDPEISLADILHEKNDADAVQNDVGPYAAWALAPFVVVHPEIIVATLSATLLTNTVQHGEASDIYATDNAFTHRVDDGAVVAAERDIPTADYGSLRAASKPSTPGANIASAHTRPTQSTQHSARIGRVFGNDGSAGEEVLLTVPVTPPFLTPGRPTHAHAPVDIDTPLVGEVREGQEEHGQSSDRQSSSEEQSRREHDQREAEDQQ